MSIVASILGQAQPLITSNPMGASESTPVIHLAGPSVDWPALLPLLILLVGGLLMLTFSSFLRGRAPKGLFATVTVVIAVAAALSALPVWARVQNWDSLLWWSTSHSQHGAFSTVGGSVGIDGFSLFITIALCSAVAMAALLANANLRREDMEGPEFYVLMLISASGGVMMAMANDLIVMFIGIETLSIAVYVLAGMHLRRVQSQESGIKYFVLGAFSSAFLYLRLIVAMFMTGGDDGADAPLPAAADRIRVPFSAGLALAVCVGVTVLFGLVPDLLVNPARDATPALVKVEATGAPASSITGG